MIRLRMQGFHWDKSSSMMGVVLKDTGTDLQLALMFSPEEANRIGVEWGGREGSEHGQACRNGNCRRYSVYRLLDVMGMKRKIHAVILDRSPEGGVLCSVKLKTESGHALHRLRAADALALSARMDVPILGTNRLCEMMAEGKSEPTDAALPDPKSVRDWLDGLESDGAAAD